LSPLLWCARKLNVREMKARENFSLTYRKTSISFASFSENACQNH